MRMISNICRNNPCYKANSTIEPKGIMIHSVGCNQPSAAVFIRQWNKEQPATTVCPHAVIDANCGDIYQTLPWEHRGWHGGGAVNDTHIGIEMCEPACIRYVSGAVFTCSDVPAARRAARKTYDAAVELCAYLCKKYGLDPMERNVIISHTEGGKLGIASSHADPEHLWNQLGLDNTMQGFREDVQRAIGGKKTLYRVQIGAFESRENAENYAAKARDDGYSAFIVEHSSAE